MSKENKFKKVVVKYNDKKVSEFYPNASRFEVFIHETTSILIDFVLMVACLGLFGTLFVLIDVAFSN